MTDHMQPLIQIIRQMSVPAPRHRFIFAFDEEMDTALFRRRCPGASLVSTARLRNRRWIANADGRATVVPSGGFDVFGVVFEVPEAVEVNLAERYPARSADRYGAFAKTDHDMLLPVEYFAPINHRHGTAGCEILRILAAARYHRFPNEYLRELSSWGPRPVEPDAAVLDR